ncbi:MAG: XRE family transcriptional regulator, partial [Eubacteriales bacterium]|nr:XRE family transcriptional regulator [Eubacteriales bacterium]
MEHKISEIAERIKGMRLILELSIADMAEYCGVSEEEYTQCEEGQRDFSFTFLYKCANCFQIDIAELITGEMPKLSFYSIVRAGKGLPIRRRAGFEYQHLAYLFKHRDAEPFVVTAPYDPQAESAPIALSTHKGQEMDFILEGSLKVQLEEHTEVLNPGDTIYYNSGHRH